MRDAIDRILAAEEEAENLKKEAQDKAASEIKAARKRGKEHIRKTNEAAHREAERMISQAKDDAAMEQKENSRDARSEAEDIFERARQREEKAVEAIVEGIVAGL